MPQPRRNYCFVDEVRVHLNYQESRTGFYSINLFCPIVPLSRRRVFLLSSVQTYPGTSVFPHQYAVCSTSNPTFTCSLVLMKAPSLEPPGLPWTSQR